MGVSASLNTTIRGALLVLLGAAWERAAVKKTLTTMLHRSKNMWYNDEHAFLCAHP